MAAIDTARSLAKKTKKQFSSLRFEERDGQFTLRLVGEQLTLREMPDGHWQLAYAVPVPAALRKGAEAKLRKDLKSLVAGLPAVDCEIGVSCQPPEGKGPIESLVVYTKWATLDGLTPPDLINTMNAVRTGALYVRSQLRELA